MFGTNYIYAVEISIVVLFCFCFDPVGISVWCTVINSSPGELIIIPECQNKNKYVLNITPGKSNSLTLLLFFSFLLKVHNLVSFSEEMGLLLF